MDKDTLDQPGVGLGGCAAGSQVQNSLSPQRPMGGAKLESLMLLLCAGGCCRILGPHRLLDHDSIWQHMRAGKVSFGLNLQAVPRWL